MSREEEIVKYQLEQHQRNQEIDKATQNMSIQERAGFVVGVEWADQHPRKGLWDSEKVIEWIKNNIFDYYVWIDDDDNVRIDMNEIIKDIKKAMEE